MGYTVAVGAVIAFLLAFVTARRRWTVLAGTGMGALLLAGIWKLASDVIGGMVNSTRELKAEDDHTVVVTLEARNADFPYLMSDFRFPIIPDGTAPGEMATAAIGTGGYILESFEPGVRAFAKRNPNYWKSDRAHFDEIESLLILDATARTNAITSGEIDAMLRPELKVVDMIAQTPGLKFIETPGGYHFTFPMRANMEPFTDNNIRMALKLAIDRQELLDKILNGHGYLGNDHPIGRSNRYYNSDLPQRQYDPEKAKWHLKQAGLEKLSVPLSVASAAFTGAIDAGTLIKEKAAAANINVDLISEPDDGYWDNVWQKKPWVAASWNGRPTEDWLLSIAYASGVPWNESAWEHEQFNKLLLAARGELDETKRREMYYEMQRLLRDEGASIIPLFANYVAVASDKVVTGEIASNWEFDGYKAPERWSFK